ncbi:NfeD family protein [Paraburkholderia sp.]|uniref:NfeD family protein n=1 Tax=Paraburkholderia sp. TaxID=1926495 RepID=UPI003D6FC102
MRTQPLLPFRHHSVRRVPRSGATGRTVHAVRFLRGAAALGIVIASAIAAISVFAATPSDAPAPVVTIPVSGAIGPASADFIVRGLAHAEERHAQLAILQLDTPGGLDTSMRQIIKAILASPVPVAAFIAPGGARAASAGTYIVYASHIAAMAPGTNLGAATPVQIGGGDLPKPSATPATATSQASSPLALDTPSTETRKQVQDASAYIRGLAQLRGRNADWAERAVREAVSLSARDALDLHVVDVVARDVPDLLHQIDGRTVETAAGAHRLETSGAPVVTFEPDWRSRFLAVVTDPNVALILMTIGMYGLFFEFANPGFVLPGVAGAISLLVGLFALQLLPINYVGLGLILLGLAFLIAEAFLPTFGTLGFGGIVAFAVGALMLIDTDVPGYGIPLPLIAALAVCGALFVFAVSSVALRARRRPVVTGSEAFVGSLGVVLDDGVATRNDSSLEGWARVHGERWRVACATPLAAGRTVRVTGRRGLLLTVVPTADAALSGASPGDHS